MTVVLTRPISRWGNQFSVTITQSRPITVLNEETASGQYICEQLRGRESKPCPCLQESLDIRQGSRARSRITMLEPAAAYSGSFVNRRWQGLMVTLLDKSPLILASLSSLPFSTRFCQPSKQGPFAVQRNSTLHTTSPAIREYSNDEIPSLHNSTTTKNIFKLSSTTSCVGDPGDEGKCT